LTLGLSRSAQSWRKSLFSAIANILTAFNVSKALDTKGKKIQALV